MLSFADWIDAVRFRWKLTAFVTLVITLLAVVYLLAAPRVYQASSALLVDARADPLKQGNSEDSQPNNRAMIATQADLIRSPSVTDLAAVSAWLTHDPSFMATWRKETNEAIPYADWLRKRLQKTIHALDKGEMVSYSNETAKAVLHARLEARRSKLNLPG